MSGAGYPRNRIESSARDAGGACPAPAPSPLAPHAATCSSPRCSCARPHAGAGRSYRSAPRSTRRSARGTASRCAPPRRPGRDVPRLGPGACPPAHRAPRPRSGRRSAGTCAHTPPAAGPPPPASAPSRAIPRTPPRISSAGSPVATVFWSSGTSSVPIKPDNSCATTPDRLFAPDSRRVATLIPSCAGIILLVQRTSRIAVRPLTPGHRGISMVDISHGN